MYGSTGIAADINSNYHKYIRPILTQVLPVAKDIKSTCHPLITPIDPSLRWGNQNKVKTSCRPKQSYLILIQMYPIAVNIYINHIHLTYVHSAPNKALPKAEDIKSICRPQQPFLGRSNVSSIAYIQKWRKPSWNLCRLICTKQNKACLLYTSPSPRD